MPGIFENTNTTIYKANTPKKSPIGIAISDMTLASLSTSFITCFFVVPIALNSPNCLILSDILILKEL